MSRLFKSFSWLLVLCLFISLFAITSVKAQSLTVSSGRIDICPPPSDPPPPPNTPFTLRARPGEDGILLEWTAPEDTSKVVGYNVYRNTDSKPYGSPINGSVVKVLKYTDT